MKIEELSERVELGEGVTAVHNKEEHTITVTGPKGAITRVFHQPQTVVEIKDGAVIFTVKNATLRHKKRIFTFKSHAKNMVKGVTEGFTYKMKICSGHFPMSVGIKGNKFEIKNFLGEKVPRVLMIKTGAEVKMDGMDLTITGIDKEIVSQTAADIEQLTRRPGFDTRIFQDGIFITVKDGRVL